MTVKKPKTPKNEAEEIKDNLGSSIALQSLHDSEGGRILIDGLVNDILGAVDILGATVTSATHAEMIALICKMKERIDLVRVLTSSKANKEVYEDLLAEVLKRQKENEPEAEPEG